MLTENLKVSKSVKKILAERAHTVYMPHMSASTFLAAWYAAEKLPLGDADNYLSVASEWENGKCQTAKAILADVSEHTFVSQQLALDIVRRIHEYRAIGGKDHVYLLLGVVGLKFMDFVEMDEEKKTQVMLKVADCIVKYNRTLVTAKTEDEYEMVRRVLIDAADYEMHQLGYGPRITNGMVTACITVIDRMIHLGKYIDTQDASMVEEWMRPFINEILEEVLNNRGNLEFAVEFIMTCKETKQAAKNMVGRQYFYNGGL